LGQETVVVAGLLPTAWPNSQPNCSNNDIRATFVPRRGREGHYVRPRRHLELSCDVLVPRTNRKLCIDMGTKEHHLAEERKLRARADECRRLARMTMDEKIRSAYVELADRYDALAEDERDLSFIYKE
jgi:hypothetical protein